VEKRVQTLILCPAVDSDPMLLFAHMVAHSAVIFLCSTIQRPSWSSMEQKLVVAAYERRASVAALEIVRLAKVVPPLSYFKLHPFLPEPLNRAATFLSAALERVVGARNGIEEILGVLEEVQGVNTFAREHLDSLKATVGKIGR
jgi:hypothetical protein